MDTVKNLIKKQAKDTLDKQILIKKFFKTIYRNIDLEQEQIRVFQNDKEGTYSKVTYFNNIDDLVNFSSSKYNCYNNTYFTLATVDGVGGAEENLKYRYCLAFDFDKKDLGSEFNHKDIINLFKANKIYCHSIVDSGNGYHTYIMINKTNNLKMVDEVQKALATKLNADLNAIKTTQILRVPYTYNVKSDKPKGVKLVHLETYDSDKFKAYDIEFLYQKNCNSKVIKSNKQITYTLNNTNMPKCIENILKNGSADGDRYRDLCNIVVALRLRNKTLGEIKEVCKEWAIKSNYNDNLNYRIENIFENKKGLELNCKECKEFNNCYDKVISDFEFIEGEELLLIPHKHAKDLKYKTRKGAKVMKANDLFIYSVLLNNKGKELTKDDITYLITDKTTGKVAMTDKTLRNTLKSLLENEYITINKGVKRLGIADKYKVNDVRCNIDKEIKISYFCTLAVIWGKMTIEEYRLYTHMRYKHHLEQLEGKAKGNIYRINQIELAKDLELTQQRISDMINGLLKSGILDIWEIKKNDKGMEYYTYRLNK